MSKDIDDRIYDVLNDKTVPTKTDETPIDDIVDYVIDISQRNQTKALMIGKLLYQAGFGNYLIENGNDIIVDLNKIPDGVLRNIHNICLK
jgi:hypothetical protein